MMGVLRHGVIFAGIDYEELYDFIEYDDEISKQSKYVCLFDPIDGSNNIDVNISIGSIFGVYRRVTEKGSIVTEKDFLQAGVRQVAAGYIIYGSSTMLVYGTRRGVNGFTLDQSIGEFCLSNPNITCPEKGNIYSVNHGNFFRYSKGVQGYIHQCQQKAYAQRYTGSLVADMHRNLIKGGIFMYPANSYMPDGKLRLMYECNPFAFIMEVAGGRATDGKNRILDIQPTSLHQRLPFFIGSKEMMADLEECIQKEKFDS
jgi:fructose-1,6-bisphosphatase I